MKKKTALIMVSALILALSACGKSAPAATTTAASEQPATTSVKDTPQENSAEQTTTAETTTNAEITAKPVEKKAGFKQTATINETVLVDKDGIKVTAKELTYSKYAASIELTLENNSDKDMQIMCGTLGYSANSVNGVMLSGAYFNCDVNAGKKAKESVSFKYDELLMYGIDEIADIELGIYSEDNDRNYTYYPVSQIKTSAADSYDYSSVNCFKSLTGSEMQSENGYTVLYSAEDKLYDLDDVSIVSEILFENRDGDTMLLLEAVNDSAYQSRISVGDIVLNGISVSSGTWTSDLVNGEKTALIDINLSSAFDKTYWELFGITEIKNLKLCIGQSDFEGKNKSKDVTIEIPVVPGGEAADMSGTVAYDADGVRLIYKGITGGRYDFDKSLYMMMLVENNSGNTIYIDEDNLSINGFMADTLAFSTHIDDGCCSVWKIEIYERSLEACDVKTPDDIKEIEFTVVVRDKNWSNEKKEGVVLKL